MTDEHTTRDFYPLRLLLAVAIGIGMYMGSGSLPFPDLANAYPARMVAAITAVTTTCWLTHALPLGAASLLPLVLMPFLGASTMDRVAGKYTHPVIWMFFGGFILALGVERWQLHRRIALGILRHAGIRPSRLVLGFMLGSGFLSMWMNNTSTTLLLFPIATALVHNMTHAKAVSAQGADRFAFALLLSIAYGASIGGMGTPIGTAPNLLFLANYTPFEAAGAPPVTFMMWMMIGIPLVGLMLPITWWLLTHVMAQQEAGDPMAHAIIEAEAKALPPMDHAERRMLAMFVMAAVLWITRRDIPLGGLGTLPGWWHMLPITHPESVGDAAVGMLVALLMFVIPSGRKPGEALMNWQHAKHLPWDILFLIGGGIAIADGFAETGLSQTLGIVLSGWAKQLPPFALIVSVCAMMTFLSEVTSNAAITALMLPIVASTSVALGLDPRVLMLPATWAASCGFMLPIATPPNAIVYASGRISMGGMARAGFLVNVLGIVLISCITWFLLIPAWGIVLDQAPAWLQQAVQQNPGPP